MIINPPTKDDGATAVYVSAAAIAAAHFMPDEEMIGCVLRREGYLEAQPPHYCGWDTALADQDEPPAVRVTYWVVGRPLYTGDGPDPWWDHTATGAQVMEQYAALKVYRSVLQAEGYSAVLDLDAATYEPSLLVRRAPPVPVPVQLSNPLLLKMDPYDADPLFAEDVPPIPTYGPAPSPALARQPGALDRQGGEHSVIIAQTADVTTLA